MRDRRPAVVLGTIFVDLKCFPEHEINFKGRNLGQARFFHGGVARNVAETMALLGASIRFCSSVQEGGVGREVLDRLQQCRIDVSGVNVVSSPDGHGMWVAILHRDGDLACSISQMPNVAHIQAAWRQARRRTLDGAGFVVLELDLSVELAEEVLADAEEAGVPVIGLPGNFDCIRTRPAMLSKLHTFICNQYEAEELFGRPVASIPAATHAVEAILERGMSQAVVTLGALGAVAMERGGAPFHVPALPVEVVDTTGAGDSFVAGISHALAAGADLKIAVQAAARVAGWTVNASESVCRDLPERIAADDWEGWARL